MPACERAMRNAILLLILLLLGCGGGDGKLAGGEAGASVQTASLTGLYESVEQGGQGARMCMISQPDGTVLFGLVTEAPRSCGGAGEAAREGNVLRLTMAGDEECVVNAQIADTQVTFPSALPAGCDYYCAPGATLAGATFQKTGGTVEDALRATDPTGDPLCG